MLNRGRVGKIVAHDNVAVDDVVEQLDEHLSVPACNIRRKSPSAQIFVKRFAVAFIVLETDEFRIAERLQVKIKVAAGQFCAKLA